MSLPLHWQTALQPQLLQDENVLNAFEVDLDTQLRFRKGFVVVTDRGLLSCAAGEASWQRWEYRDGLQLTHHDHAGV
ncbi:hypothetical protein, partial [Sphingomonas sp. 10B4]|uniref:hypothetical protein n=1 Tax=Sphingomonas sp. 10B4 TaxID=3048575 RepID=UPI002B2255BD